MFACFVCFLLCFCCVLRGFYGLFFALVFVCAVCYVGFMACCLPLSSFVLCFTWGLWLETGFHQKKKAGLGSRFWESQVSNLEDRWVITGFESCCASIQI